MELAHDNEELLTNLDQARLLAKKIDYTIKQLKSDVTHNKFQYNPYQNGPKWFENQCEQLSKMADDLFNFVQNI